MAGYFGESGGEASFMDIQLISALTGAAPPQLFVPSLGDALLGWVMGVLVLAGPFALVLASWQRRHGRWWYLFTQWDTLAFWMLVVGSIVAAVGMFGLLGVVPAWQMAWNAWYLGVITSNPGADPAIFTWLQGMQQQYSFALQVTASIIFLLGAATVAVGQSRLARKMAFFQREGSDDWLVSPAETPAPATTRRATRPLAGDGPIHAG
jgi:hypothetical protein